MTLRAARRLSLAVIVLTTVVTLASALPNAWQSFGVPSALAGSSPAPENELATGISAVMNSKLDGLALMGFEEREQLRRDARSYIRFRRNPRSKAELSAWKARCESGSPAPIFCRAKDFEAAAAGTSAEKRGKSLSPQEEQRLVAQAIQTGDVDLLEDVSDSAISRGFSRASGRPQLLPLEKTLLEARACSHVRIATLMGSKYEEFLPGREQLDATIAVYQKAALCEEPQEFSERAGYRASLLLISREDWSAAIPLLEKLARNKESDFYSRAIYWRARAEKARGNGLGFRQLASRLTKEFPIHYHSLLLAPRVLFNAAQNLHLSEPTVALQCRNLGKEWDSRVRAVEAIQEAGAPEFARDLLAELEARIEGAEAEARLYLAVLQHRSQNTIGTFRVLSSLFREHPSMLSRQTLALFFPLGKSFESFLNVAHGGGLDPYLIAALIRQESGFVPHARSRAGALGLMQLMPATARQLESVSKRELLDGRTNVRLGVKFFRQLLNRFDGKVDHALAAYNAGPLRVEAWQRRYPVADPVLFVDLIPIKETREYVSLISRNYYWYLHIYARHIFDERLDAALDRTRNGERVLAAAGESASVRPGNKFPLEFSLFHSH